MDDGTAHADDTMAAKVADTTALPDMPPTEIAELAWSSEDEGECEQAGDEAVAPRRLVRSLLRWCVALTAVVVTATASGWLGTVYYHEEESTPIAVRDNRLTPGPTVSTPAPTVPNSPVPLTAPSTPPPPDAFQTYRRLMRRDGLVPLDDPKYMDQIRITICGGLQAGDASTVEQQFHESMRQSSPTLSPTEVQTSLADTVKAYCPQYADALSWPTR